MNKLRVINRSVLCCHCGCYGLIPVLGLLPAVMAVLLYQQVRYEVGQEWNPAGRHALWGFILAWVGLAVTTATLGLGLAVAVPELI